MEDLEDVEWVGDDVELSDVEEIGSAPWRRLSLLQRGAWRPFRSLLWRLSCSGLYDRGRSDERPVKADDGRKKNPKVKSLK